jgi:hypothetical protein
MTVLNWRARAGSVSASPAPFDVQAIRRHFMFPERGRIVTNNAASTQPPRELLELQASFALAAVAAVTRRTPFRLLPAEYSRSRLRPR